MNSSNQPYEGAAPENVERRMNPSTSSSSMMDRVGAQQLTEIAWREPSPDKCSSPGSPNSGTSLGEDAKLTDSPVEEVFKIPERYTKNGRRKAVSFPLKLMQVLSIKEHADIIAWQPDGKSFKIVRPRAFKKDILPRYFREAKYSSFKRKISRWGFERVKSEDEETESDWFGSEVFYHEYFQRGMVDLVEKMSCKKAVPVHPSISRTAAPRPSKPKAKRVRRPQVEASPATPQRQAFSAFLGTDSGEIRRQQISSFASLPMPDLGSTNPRGVPPTMDSLEVAIDSEVHRRLGGHSMMRPSLDSLDVAIDAEVQRRLRERETELALNRNMRLNALVQEQLSGSRLSQLSAATGGARSDLLSSTGLYQSGMSSNLNAMQLLGQQQSLQQQQEPPNAAMEEQRRRIRLLQQAQFFASMSSGNQGTEGGNFSWDAH